MRGSQAHHRADGRTAMRQVDRNPIADTQSAIRAQERAAGRDVDQMARRRRTVDREVRGHVDGVAWKGPAVRIARASVEGFGRRHGPVPDAAARRISVGSINKSLHNHWSKSNYLETYVVRCLV